MAPILINLNRSEKGLSLHQAHFDVKGGLWTLAAPYIKDRNGP
jgi:hypothetical protein